MPLWGSKSNHVVFTADATIGSSRLNNVTVGAGYSFTDLDLGQLVVSTGTTGVPYDSRIRNIGVGATYIDLTNPYIAETGTTLSFEAIDSYKPEKAIVGNKAFDGADVFANRSGWVQRHYKKRIDFTGKIASGSTIITNVSVASGRTADLQLGQLVGGVGIPGDYSDKKGVYIKRLLPAAGTGVTGIILSDPANQSASGRALNAYSYWDEVVVGIRELSGRLAEPEITSVSFDKTNYTENSIGYVVVSFNEAVNVAKTTSLLYVTTSTGSTVATYSRGSGTNKIYYRFNVGSAGTISIEPQSIVGTGATISGVDKNRFNISFTGDLTEGSKVVKNVTNISQLRYGYPVSGSGITSSTTIELISAGSSSITLSTSALSTGSTVTITVSESNAKTVIYASYLVGAGSTTRKIDSQLPKYSGTGTSQLAYYGGTYAFATVS